MPQRLNVKKGQQYKKTFSLSHYLSEIGHTKSNKGINIMVETFSRNKKHCSSRNEKASQILADSSHATFVLQ
jgi:hypothetical protein